MNAAVTCELTGAEVWVSKDSDRIVWSIRVEVRKRVHKLWHRFNSHHRDLTARRDEGHFWDLGTREDRERWEQMQQEHQTELLIEARHASLSERCFIPVERRTRVQYQERLYTRACIEG